MKFSFTKWNNKRNDDTEKAQWFQSSRMSSLISLESIKDRTRWNFSLRKKQNQSSNSTINKHIESQSTIIIDEDKEEDYISSRSKNPPKVMEPVKIERCHTFKNSANELLENLSLITIKQSELNLLINPQIEPRIEKTDSKIKNLFTPRFVSITYFQKKKRIGKICPEYLSVPRRRWTPNDLDSTVWNSISLQIPPPLVLETEIIQKKEEISITTLGKSFSSIEQSVNAIFQKVLNDPIIKTRFKNSRTIKNWNKSRVSLNNIKYLPKPFSEPLTEGSSVEVFEQELISYKMKRKTKRAWTSEPKESNIPSEWSILKWMGTPSLTLNALALPTLSIPFPHVRDQSLDYQIELSSLGSEI